MKRRTKGIACIIASAFCFSLMNLFVRLAGDLPTVQKSFFRNCVALVFALIILVRQGERPKIGRGDWKYLLLRSAAGTVGILCNFYAVDHLAQSDASMLNKMSPFCVILFSYLILKEKLTRWQLSAVILAFTGSLFVIKPTFQNLALVPSLIGLLGGISAGFAYTQVRRLGLRGVKSPVIVAVFSGFSCLVTLPALVFDFHPMTAMQLACLLCAGLAASGGQFGITLAYTYAPGREVSVYDYTQILFSTLLGFLVFDQLPDGWSFLGYALIIAAAVFVFLYNNGRLKRLTPPEEV
jgi:drug/metabolite transporter (DMT)-like permease